MPRKKTITEIVKNPETGSTIVQEVTEESTVPQALESLRDQFNAEAGPTAQEVPPGPQEGPQAPGDARPKRKYTKRKGVVDTSEIEAKEKAEQAKQVFSSLGGVAYDIIVNGFDNIPAKDMEKELFANATGAMIEKYMVRAGDYVVEITFALAVGNTVLPRLIRFLDEKKKRKPVLIAEPPSLPPTVALEVKPEDKKEGTERATT